ncbi:MAG TPA: CHAT domain-containing protein [Thermoanaerobaculia bacterium]|nr:CHAT domain-containing protein [Thermoanaerobaculia bacterium]
MTRHLDRCETCREDVAALTEFVAAPVAANVVRFEAASTPRWWIAAAASLVTLVGAAIAWQITHRNQSPIAPLVAASSRLGYRSIEARLSGGFEWATPRDPFRSSIEDSNPKEQQLAGVAGTVRERADANPGDAPLQHAAAVASLLTGKPRAAIERLEKVAQERPDDARVWSDLAAARHAAAMRFDMKSEEPDALAAVDRALKIDPRLPEALFNRALILESLGVMAQAREAWDQYLAIDSTSAWAQEARTRRDAIRMTTTRKEFRKQLPRLESRAADGDVRFVAHYPEESRQLGENRSLGAWAAAYQAGNAGEAQRQLAIARAIGGALEAESGEHLLSDLVATIDRAKDAERARLAAAHVVYQQAYAARGLGQHAAARPQYLRAAALFGETPGALWARFWAADAENLAGDVQTARREFEELSASVSDRYKALIGLIGLMRGTAEAKLVHWQSAIDHLNVALAHFQGIGERLNAAVASGRIAESAAILGRRDEAWNAWSTALRTASEIGENDYVYGWLNVTGNAENLFGHREAAMSLLDLAIRQGGGTPAARAEVFFRRAILSARAGETADAVRFVAEGQAAAGSIEDEIPRENTLADFDVAEGIVYARSDPQRALAALTRAIGLRSESRTLLLPPTLLERARVLRSLGRGDEAIADLQSAIVISESQRGSVQWKDMKSDALGGIDEIYTSLAELLLERGKFREAFMTADRAAAHAFYGAAAAKSVLPLDALQQRLGPNDVVLEYLVLPRKTIVFAAALGRFETRETAIASTEVARRVSALDQALRDRLPIETVQRASSELHEILIAPVHDLLRAGTSIIFVSDPLLASVPFAALFDAKSGRWLIEEHALHLVPSALVHDVARTETSSAVVAIRPATKDVDLPRTVREIETVTRLYPQATVMEGKAATLDSVLDAIRDADIVHYAGHTNSDTEAGLLLRAGTIVYGADVARITLRGSPLVVLAGCRTLRGGARREDLATSLARAFLLAGARAVVGTAWDVEDGPAAELFTRFLESNAQTGDAVAALSGAQRSMLQHRGRHPSDWAFAQIVVRAL